MTSARPFSLSRALAAASALGLAAALAACQAPAQSADVMTGAETAMQADTAKLETVVAARSAEDRARDDFRNPAETLAFFGIAPTDTVVEVSPGGGWYSRVLLPYLAGSGEYVALLNDPQYFLQRPDLTEEQRARVLNMEASAREQLGEFAAPGQGFDVIQGGNLSNEMRGMADAAVTFRSLHGLARTEGPWLDNMAADLFAVLKPGGTLGVVQHRAPESATGDAASGRNGYLRQSDVVALFEEAGFVLEDSSEINANANDRPGAEDIVWRLPPTFNGVPEDDMEERAARMAIGESDRMTLRFRKPG